MKNKPDKKEQNMRLWSHRKSIARNKQHEIDIARRWRLIRAWPVMRPV